MIINQDLLMRSAGYIDENNIVSSDTPTNLLVELLLANNYYKETMGIAYFKFEDKKGVKKRIQELVDG